MIGFAGCVRYRTVEVPGPIRVVEVPITVQPDSLFLPLPPDSLLNTINDAETVQERSNIKTAALQAYFLWTVEVVMLLNALPVRWR
ncbi:MAG: hypothetical protein RhofKO_26020 [Rhodothermales bacterium]